MPSVPKAISQTTCYMTETRTLHVIFLGTWRNRGEWFWPTAMILLEAQLMGNEEGKDDELFALS